ncbi:Hypothetical_protein [Hexamita inflata]|uniref:Hypothetical_protein n=1 Tax=Hexamita inflata TaxID=28002 RepID=A0AA86R6Y8_9EUKA|nr:Hypothetical protein HINF_LOCUS54804 [Hexamita inflata]
MKSQVAFNKLDGCQYVTQHITERLQLIITGYCFQLVLEHRNIETTAWRLTCPRSKVSTFPILFYISTIFVALQLCRAVLFDNGRWYAVVFRKRSRSDAHRLANREIYQKNIANVARTNTLIGILEADDTGIVLVQLEKSQIAIDQRSSELCQIFLSTQSIWYKLYYVRI